MRNEILNLAYMDNYRVTCQTGALDPKQFSVADDEKDAFRKKDINLKRFSAGQIRLPTGVICALDPLTLLDNAHAIRFSVQPGSYPVYLSIAHMVMNWPVVRNRKMSFEPSPDRRVAFAMIQFNEKPVMNWQPAYFSEQDESEIKEGTSYGYWSYSGKGCFMDKSLAEMLRRQYGTDFGYFDGILSEMNRTSYTCSFTNLEFERESNLIAFSTGFGMGVYASYFGFAEAGELVCLVTDFGIVRPMGIEKPEVKPYTPAGTERGLWVGTKYDYRLTGQEKYLKGVKLVRCKYRQNPKNPKWDHDHCEFCSSTFCLEEHSDCLKEGYATLDDYRWICPTCFEDFKDLFGWEVVTEADA